MDQLLKDPPPAAKACPQISLYAMEFASGAVTLVAGQPDPRLDHCGSPSWTQDGTRIYFDAQPRDHLEKTRLKAIGRAGYRWALLDLGPGNCPTPSPAGDRVIFLLNAEQVPGAETGVWIMQDDGSERRRLGGYGQPKWSPDGHQFLIVSFSNPCNVTVIDDRSARKCGAVQIHGYQIFSIPAWADDETIVAVIGAAGSTVGDTLALVNLAQPKAARIETILWKKRSGPEIDPMEPAYSPATDRCVFVGRGLKGMALYSLEKGKPGLPRRLEPQGDDNLIRDLAFSPDGHFILFSSNRPDRPR